MTTIHHPFHIAVAFDLAAVLLWAMTGAIAGMRKGYDFVGVTVLALVTALAGGMLRDVLLARGTPASLTDGRYLLAALTGGAAALLFRALLHHLRVIFTLADALGVGIYAVVGTQKALSYGLPVVSSVMLGVVTAVGGGVVRDVLVREEPLVFKPGEWYALAALAGSVVFAGLVVGLRWDPTRAALLAIATAFAARMLSLRLGWRTEPVAWADPSV
ncbi:MAG: trimeric intracellular cation channel family protein [Anaeromyxobacteraceae bacterium]